MSPLIIEMLMLEKLIFLIVEELQKIKIAYLVIGTILIRKKCLNLLVKINMVEIKQ